MMRRHLLLALTFALCGAALTHSLACASGPRAKPEHPATPNMNAKRYQSLQRLAAQDLKCGSEQVAYSYSQEGLHVMSGCGATERYFLHCPSATCIWMPSPTKQGSFDLDCAEAQLELVTLDRAQYGVSGCGGRASYVALCKNNVCQWIPSTQVLGAAQGAAPEVPTGGSLAPEPEVAPAPAAQPEPGLAPAAPR